MKEETIEKKDVFLGQVVWKFFNKAETGKYIFLLLNILVIWFASLFAWTTPVDPDFGWHLRNGEFIWQNKRLPSEEFLSYTFTTEKYVSHEWLMEVAQYLLYNRFGFMSIMILADLIVVAAFLLPTFLVKNSPLARFVLLPMAYLISWPVLMFGQRPQLFTILGLSFFYFALVTFRDRNSRWIYFLPFFMLIWANIHAGFSAGLGLLTIFTGGEFLRRMFYKAGLNFPFLASRNFLTNNQLKKLLIIGFLTFFASVFNPSGAAVFFGSVKAAVFTEPVKILEWTPVDFSSWFGLMILALIIVGGAILAVLGQKVVLTEVLIFLFFAYMAILARRHLPLFAVTMLPVFLPQLTALGKIQLPKLFKSGVLIVSLLAGGYLLWGSTFSRVTDSALKTSSMESYSGVIGQPYQAIAWIKTNRPEGRMLNFYDWGGFLTWQLPEYKVFVDGRLPGTFVFADYQKMVMMENGWQDLIKKYQIAWVFLPKTTPLVQQLAVLPRDWKIAYQDQTAVIFTKKTLK